MSFGWSKPKSCSSRQTAGERSAAPKPFQVTEGEEGFAMAGIPRSWDLGQLALTPRGGKISNCAVMGMGIPLWTSESVFSAPTHMPL